MFLMKRPLIHQRTVTRLRLNRTLGSLLLPVRDIFVAEQQLYPLGAIITRRQQNLQPFSKLCQTRILCRLREPIRTLQAIQGSGQIKQATPNLKVMTVENLLSS